MTTQQTHTLTRTTLIGTRYLRRTKPSRSDNARTGKRSPHQRDAPTFETDRRLYAEYFAANCNRSRDAKKKNMRRTHSYVSHAASSLSAASIRSTCLLVKKVVLHFFFLLTRSPCGSEAQENERERESRISHSHGSLDGRRTAMQFRRGSLG